MNKCGKNCLYCEQYLAKKCEGCKGKKANNCSIAACGEHDECYFCDKACAAYKTEKEAWDAASDAHISEATKLTNGRTAAQLSNLILAGIAALSFISIGSLFSVFTEEQYFLRIAAMAILCKIVSANDNQKYFTWAKCAAVVSIILSVVIIALKGENSLELFMVNGIRSGALSIPLCNLAVAIADLVVYLSVIAAFIHISGKEDPISKAASGFRIVFFVPTNLLLVVMLLLDNYGKTKAAALMGNIILPILVILIFIGSLLYAALQLRSYAKRMFETRAKEHLARPAMQVWLFFMIPLTVALLLQAGIRYYCTTQATREAIEESMLNVHNDYSETYPIGMIPGSASFYVTDRAGLEMLTASNQDDYYHCSLVVNKKNVVAQNRGFSIVTISSFFDTLDYLYGNGVFLKYRLPMADYEITLDDGTRVMGTYVIDMIDRLMQKDGDTVSLPVSVIYDNNKPSESYDWFVRTNSHIDSELVSSSDQFVALSTSHPGYSFHTSMDRYANIYVLSNIIIAIVLAVTVSKNSLDNERYI